MEILEQIRALYARIAELTAEELAELFALIQQATEQLAEAETSAETTAALQELADINDGAQAEQTSRQAEEQRLADEAEAALARLRGDTPEEQTDSEAAPEGDGDEGDGADADNPEGDAPVEGDQPAPEEQPDNSQEGDQAADEPQGVAAAASAGSRRPAVFGAGRGAAPSRTRSPAPAAAPVAALGALTASADGGPVLVGRPISDRSKLGEAMSRMLQTIGYSGGGGEGFTLHPVAHAEMEYPAERQLSGDLTDDASRIEKHLEQRWAAMHQTALTAAGGLCAPAETIYDIRVLGSVARPVRGALPSFQARRGAVQLRPPIGYRSLEGSITDWTMANDANPGTDGPTTKNIIDVVCPTPFTVTVEGGVVRIRFHNVTARFDPEMVGANTQAAQVAFARHQENKLLAKMDAQMKTLTAGKVLGATRDILATVDKIQSYYRNRHRLEQQVPLQCILPLWALNLMRADITRQLATDNTADALAIADAQVVAWFTRRNIAVTFHLDGSEAAVTGPPAIARQSYADAAANAAVPGFPDQLVMRLFADGDFLFLDGGTLDLGVVRDATLNAVNQYETFFEEFNGVAFNGVEALRVVATVQPTGQSAGTADTSAVAD